MYNLYLINNGLVSVFFFETQQECVDFVSPTSNPKFLISKSDNKINFVQAMEWDSVNKKININIDKAKEIKKNELRFLRQNKFDKLDSIYMKAFQLNDQEKMSKVVDLKQRLRDITSISIPNDIDELMNFTPTIFLEVESLFI